MAKVYTQTSYCVPCSVRSSVHQSVLQSASVRPYSSLDPSARGRVRSSVCPSILPSFSLSGFCSGRCRLVIDVENCNSRTVMLKASELGKHLRRSASTPQQGTQDLLDQMMLSSLNYSAKTPVAQKSLYWLDNNKYPKHVLTPLNYIKQNILSEKQTVSYPFRSRFGFVRFHRRGAMFADLLLFAFPAVAILKSPMSSFIYRHKSAMNLIPMQIE